MFRSPPVDIIVVLIIVLLILGPKRLPGIGKGLGQGMREFKEGITGDAKDEEKPTLSEARGMPERKPDSTEPAATSGSGGPAGSERSS
ncbi:MAG: twin-arginine translocase TatA/TatE family subunit [Solirubrobacteraceae bacterium]